MATYENYKINGRTISELLEDSSNRNNSNYGMNGFNIGSATNSSKMSFASYNSYYHPFIIDTKINNYFSNNYTSINKGFVHRGGAPLLNERSLGCTSHNYTVIYSYVGTGVGTDLGVLYRDQNGSLSSEGNCPSSVVFAIIGAGGGGAGGGGWWKGKRSYGGGCGPLLIINVELPYKQTTRTEFLKVELGGGGSGGGAWSNGSNGSQTKVYFKQGSSWILVATLDGGRGGENTAYSVVSAPTTDLAITKITFNKPINSSILSNGDGYGKLTINNSCRYFSWGSGTYAYMPGNYYSLGTDDSYNQANYYSPKITSGSNFSLSYIGIGSYTSGYGEKGSLFATNRMYYGKTSVFAQGGSYAQTGTGGSGSWGSGGGGGGSATSGFDKGIGSGGRGGAAGVKVYW